MNWEQLTAPEFAQAVKDTKVCLLATGCLEKHFDHLPLGTDTLRNLQRTLIDRKKEPCYHRRNLATVYEPGLQRCEQKRTHGRVIVCWEEDIWHYSCDL